jgi:hypothetical protein
MNLIGLTVPSSAVMTTDHHKKGIIERTRAKDKEVPVNDFGATFDLVRRVRVSVTQSLGNLRFDCGFNLWHSFTRIVARMSLLKLFALQVPFDSVRVFKGTRSNNDKR